MILYVFNMQIKIKILKINKIKLDLCKVSKLKKDLRIMVVFIIICLWIFFYFFALWEDQMVRPNCQSVNSGIKWWAETKDHPFFPLLSMTDMR
jgi:hypothetical protein